MIPWRVRNQLRCFDMCWWMYFGQKTLENGTPKDTQTIQYPKYKPYLIHVCIFIVYLHIFVLLVQRCACVHAFYLREHSFWMLCDALFFHDPCCKMQKVDVIPIMTFYCTRHSFGRISPVPSDTQKIQYPKRYPSNTPNDRFPFCQTFPLQPPWRGFCC